MRIYTMQVTVTFLGPLAEQTGTPTMMFALPKGASYGDLLDEIGATMGHRFHDRIWDNGQRQFKPGILVIGRGRDLDARDASLADGEEIKIVPMVSGG